ncbi:hypothetical protein AGR1B_Cc10097 [Agrobacterium fabacearum S56]|nr:hypothetical protein AGR1B_Cc10097 [Agrobacterium fabacearum S56]
MQDMTADLDSHENYSALNTILI